jgi:hypothetical protein
LAIVVTSIGYFDYYTNICSIGQGMYCSERRKMLYLQKGADFMEYTVFYPTPLSDLDPKDGNLDVCVTFADGQDCTFVFATPQNLVTLMKGGGEALSGARSALSLRGGADGGEYPRLPGCHFR